MDPKPKIKKVMRSGAPAKGYKWKEQTSGKIPNPEIVPMKKKMAKLKPMRMVSSGTTGYGTPSKTIKNKARSL